MDRRSRERYPFRTPAVIESGTVRSGGQLLDVSESGARIRLQSSPFLGPLCVITAIEFGVRVPARVVWRHGCEVGIHFLSGLVDGAFSEGFGRRRHGSGARGA